MRSGAAYRRWPLACWYSPMASRALPHAISTGSKDSWKQEQGEAVQVRSQQDGAFGHAWAPQINLWQQHL
jgi:hypothetical protein